MRTPLSSNVRERARVLQWGVLNLDKILTDEGGKQDMNRREYIVGLGVTVALAGCTGQSTETTPTPETSTVVSETEFEREDDPPDSHRETLFEDWAVVNKGSTNSIVIQGNIPGGNDCHIRFLDKVTYDEQADRLRTTVRIKKRDDVNACSASGGQKFFYRTEVTLESGVPVNTVQIIHYFQDEEKFDKSVELAD